MPKKAVDGGGGLYLGAQGLLALAGAGAVVLAQRVERMADYKSDKPEHKHNKPVAQIKTHILVVASKGDARNGEFWPDQNLIHAGWTNKLGDGSATDGEVIAGVAATYGDNRACLNAPSGPDYAAIEEFYRDRGLNPDDTADDAKLFKTLLAEHAAGARAEVRDAVAQKGTPRDDDIPPF